MGEVSVAFWVGLILVYRIKAFLVPCQFVQSKVWEICKDQTYQTASARRVKYLADF